MMDLRSRLQRIDPTAQQPGDVGRADIAALLEEIMSTPVDTDRSTSSTGGPTPAPSPLPRRRSAVLLIGAAAVVAAVAIGLIVANGGDEPDQEAALTLSLPDPLSMSSCLPFDVSTLADMPVAFAGTVTGVDHGAVTIEVDRWFNAETSETSDVVQLSVPSAMTSAALDGVDFVPGQRYLVTATNGIVNGCGFSGPATPDLEAAFEQAFPQ